MSKTRHVVVTGASRGTGRAAAFHFATVEHARLTLIARGGSALEETASGVRARGGEAIVAPGDVTDRARLAAIAAGSAPVDVLVVNAGRVGMTPVARKGADADFDDILAIDLTGAWNTVRAFNALLDRGARVVMVSCVLGRFGAPGFGAYCAAKHGLLGLTKALAQEMLPRGIYVNALAPAWVETEMSQVGIAESAEALGITRAEFRKVAESHMAIKRFIEPEEVARGIAWLADPANQLQVGQCLNLDGGCLQD